jgi:hypothetical protein
MYAASAYSLGHCGGTDVIDETHEFRGHSKRSDCFLDESGLPKPTGPTECRQSVKIISRFTREYYA